MNKKRKHLTIISMKRWSLMNRMTFYNVIIAWFTNYKIKFKIKM